MTRQTCARTTLETGRTWAGPAKAGHYVDALRRVVRQVWRGTVDTPQSVPAEEAYALWAENYPPWPHNALMQVEQDAMAPIIASTAPRRALDVGTGSGRYLPTLSATGARLVVGVDRSLPMLNQVRRRPGPPTMSACGDACRLPFGDCSFDLVCASLMVGDLPVLAAWIGEMARVVAPGGHLVYSDFHPSWVDRRWRRTFRAADGRCIELPYFPHAIAEHRALLEAASFEVRAIHEPALARAVSADDHDVAVVVVCHAVKRSG